MATVVTRKGKEILGQRLSAAGTEPKFLLWGLNPSGLTAAATDVAEFQESGEARVSGTSSLVTTTTANDTYQVSGTMTASTTRAITESALGDSGTQPAQATLAAGGIAGLNGGGTTLTTNATFTPGNGNFIQVRAEVMQVTAGSGTTSLTVVRAQNGTSSGTTFATNDPVTPGNPPGQSGVTGGDLFTHGDYAVINLASGDSIAFTWKVQFT